MIIRPRQLKQKFQEIRYSSKSRLALSTGFPTLDPHFKLAKNYFMVVSGYPGSGKSEFVDAIMVNMALQHNWKTQFFSPENNPLEEHMAKIAEKFIGKQLRHFSADELGAAHDFIDQSFTWTDPDFPTIDLLFENALEVKNNTGLDALVWDPWNSIMHKRGQLREDEYLMEVLSRVLVFARKNNLLFIVIAHPKTLTHDKTKKMPIPGVNDVSGGVMWWNKADYAVVCHRPDRNRHIMDVYTQKVKQKWMGKEGVVQLDYDVLSGRYKCKDAPAFYLPTDIRDPF